MLWARECKFLWRLVYCSGLAGWASGLARWLWGGGDRRRNEPMEGWKIHSTGLHALSLIRAAALLPSLTIWCLKTTLPSDRVDRDTGGESEQRLRMSLKPRKWFLAYVLIHLHCPDPPHLSVFYHQINKMGWINRNYNSFYSTKFSLHI